MKITIIAVGKTATSYIQNGIDTYMKRLRHYLPVELVIIPDIKQTRALTSAEQKVREGMAMLQMLQPGDRVVLLDERGVELSSRDFSERLSKRMNQGLRRLVFIVGGPYGFSDEVYTRADSQLSLSKMTFTHEMVRLFFVEQVYRAMTILAGEPYHHD